MIVSPFPDIAAAIILSLTETVNHAILYLLTESVLKGRMHMKNFFALDEEKQTAIINAALQCFGKHGYEKASMNNIAQSANISKASMFHYFGTKKQLYEYLLDYSRNIILDSLQEMNDSDDLFDRVLASSSMKLEVLKRNPYISQFIAGAWNENIAELQDVTSSLRAETNQFRSELIFKQDDAKKFKNPDDAKMVAGILMLMAEGYAIRFQKEIANSECDLVMTEFREMMETLRRNFYKEEYLL